MGGRSMADVSCTSCDGHPTLGLPGPDDCPCMGSLLRPQFEDRVDIEGTCPRLLSDGESESKAHVVCVLPDAFQSGHSSGCQFLYGIALLSGNFAEILCETTKRGANE